MRLVFMVPPAINDFDARTMAPIFTEPGLEVVGAVIDTRRPKRAHQRILEEFKRGRGGYVLVMIANKLWERKLDAPPEPSRAYFERRGVPIHLTAKLYAPETVEWIRARRPDVIYRSGFGIIREPLLSMAPNGVLSYHHGNIRKYRGQPVAFWELYNAEKELGVTVQALNEGLDSGKIVAEITVPIEPNDSWTSLYHRAYRLSDGLLLEACRRLRTDGFLPVEVPEAELGRLYTSPNFRQWLMLHVKVAGRKLRHLFRR